MIIQPPYEEHGFRFETTWYKMVIHLPEIRSFVSLTPFYTLVVRLAMEHFLQNTQGQCGEYNENTVNFLSFNCFSVK